MRTTIVGAALLLGAIVAAAFVPVDGERVEAASIAQHRITAREMDLSAYSSTNPQRRLSFLFIHHSVGGQLLADPPHGRPTPSRPTDANGGGLRTLLEHAGYAVQTATYGSRVGEDTDLRHWLPKFKTQMDAIRRTQEQNTLLPEGERNHIVAFKSCFPNSAFVADGAPPGDASNAELTVENAKATLRALLPLFERQPDTLFIYFTAPPLAPRLAPAPAWKWALKHLLGRGMTAEKYAAMAHRARVFNTWARSPEGWLANYSGKNVVVFDFYDVLTGGHSDLLAYPTGNGVDSHPSREGLERAAAAFVPFLNRAVRRAQLTE